jgi:CofH subfamily radical SAM domain protein
VEAAGLWHRLGRRVERLWDEHGLGDRLFRVVGGRARPGDIVRLYRAPLWLLGLAAGRVRELLTGRRVGYIVNTVVNYSNVCVVGCSFCSFYRPRGHPEAYTLEPREIVARVRLLWERLRVRQVLLQGGVNPELGLGYYLETIRGIKEATGGRVAVHGLSVAELVYLSRRERMSIAELVARLRGAGLDSVPGALELLSPRVSRVLAPAKPGPGEWLSTMAKVMEQGVSVSATMVYGHVESLWERAEHLLQLLELQRRYGRIMAFIAWNYEPGGNRLGREIPHRAWGGELLRSVAVARLVLRGEILWIQAGWLTAGPRLGAVSLEYGANDWGGTLYGERVLPAAGVTLPRLVRENVERIIADAGFEPFERDNWYGPVTGGDGGAERLAAGVA